MTFPRRICTGLRRSGVPLALALLLAGTGPAMAQTTSFGGQIRPRSEVRDPAGEGTEAFTSMRTRIHLRSLLAPTVRAFVQVQDVRFWGEETSTLADFQADGLDLHQAWLEFGEEGESSLWIRAGRQETILGGERLVGAVGWTQQGRAFDGVRGAALLGRLRLELFGFQLAEEAAGSAQADAAFYGAYGVIDAGPGRSLDLYVLHDRAESAADIQRFTLGGRYEARQGPWSYRAEASVQTGEMGDLDVSTFMAGARLGRTVAGGEGGVTLWYDFLSGDEDPDDDETGVFNTLFATNHKFYGFADLFLNIPAHTAGRGLQDAAVKTHWDVNEKVRLSLDLHHFRVAEDRGLSTGRLGEELDLTGRWRYESGVTFTGGVSWVAQGDAFQEIGRLAEDMFWGYLMVSAGF